jgi:hypothetical protein
MIAYAIIRWTLYQERHAAREAINKGRDTRVFERKKSVIKNKMDIIVSVKSQTPAEAWWHR